VCDIETSRTRWPRPELGCCATKRIIIIITIIIIINESVNVITQDIFIIDEKEKPKILT
jgi:hypothetical protein